MSARLSQLLSRPWVRRLGEVALVLGVFLTVQAYQARDVPRGALPAFALTSLSGAHVTSESLRGKRTLLVVWAPWCGVCRFTSRNVSWVRGLVGARANVLSIASHYGDVSEVARYVEEQGVDYPVLLGDRALARALGVHAFPTALVLDEGGTLVRASVGYTTTLGLLIRLLV